MFHFSTSKFYRKTPRKEALTIFVESIRTNMYISKLLSLCIVISKSIQVILEECTNLFSYKYFIFIHSFIYFIWDRFRTNPVTSKQKLSNHNCGKWTQSILTVSCKFEIIYIEFGKLLKYWKLWRMWILKSGWRSIIKWFNIAWYMNHNLKVARLDCLDRQFNAFSLNYIKILTNNAVSYRNVLCQECNWDVKSL